VGTGLLTVALDFILIPRMGIQGAALASSVAYLSHAVLVATALKHILQVSWRALLIPSRREFSIYRSAWRDYRSKIARARFIDAISIRE
jgi:Na+-driven multidrug efflux pump